MACSDDSPAGPSDGGADAQDASIDVGDSRAPDALVDALVDAPPDDAGDAASGDASDGAIADAADASDTRADSGIPAMTDWMAAIDPARSIASLSIPGTHDTGARFENAPGTLKCQDLTITEQLTAGIRYFDIRTRNVNNKFDIYHTNVYQDLSFDDVMTSILAFFGSHPGEALVMSFKEEQPQSGSTNTFEQTFDAYVAMHPERWYLGASMPTMADARGKIVLLRRFNATTTPKGIDAAVWADNTTFSIDNAAHLRIQDYYEISGDDAKWTTITGLFTEAKGGPATTMYLNNTSAYLPLDGGVEDIPDVSNVINPKIATFFGSNASGRYGIVAMDFADAAKSALIVRTNFE